MELQPLTGLRHQLLRHMKHIAHPIIGDSTHGKGPLNRALASFLGVQRMWLHAGALTVAHPHPGRRIYGAHRLTIILVSRDRLRRRFSTLRGPICVIRRSRPDPASAPANLGPPRAFGARSGS